MLALNGVLQGWDRGLAGTMTVELPPTRDAANDKALAQVLAVLRATPGITDAAAIGRAAEGKLLEPFLGTAVTPDELQLPRLIDLRIASGAALDLGALRTKLVAAAPGAVLDDHRLWLDRLAALGFSIELTALVILALVGAAAVLAVIFTTRTGLSVHRDVIELLHLMGARDGYIAGQFQHQALRLGLGGGLIGLVLALVTLAGLSYAASAAAELGQAATPLPNLQLAPWHWVTLGLLPGAAALIAMLTARLTVLGALARMP
jgi:cell division transport system permease protein